MTDRLFVDLGSDQVTVATSIDGELSAGEPSAIGSPLDDEALEDLRWYFEDYLRAPFGVYGERGPRVEARLAEWGAALFSAVFGTGVARDAYQRMLAGMRELEIVFRSSSPRLLGLPWELIWDPAHAVPLALEVGSLNRSLFPGELTEMVPVPDERLRVLMVISRPARTRDLGYRIIARPLLDRLKAARSRVDLTVLRPPTLKSLQETLEAAVRTDTPFQIVHFDGHGALRARRGAAGWAFLRDGPEAVLVFERPSGGPDNVPASRVAQLLKAGQVSVAVLNACQSGAVGRDVEAAIASRLLKEGIASVVAMAYAIHAVAAAEFMAAFYDRLFAGDAVSIAVTAGRRRLCRRNLRPSPKGDMPLADWLVPVHYRLYDISFPEACFKSIAGADQTSESLRQRSIPPDPTGDLDSVDSFVGRDALFYELEMAAWRQRVVVLHGPAGAGKTELAKAFGRWWRDTGGTERPEWVFWQSFEPGLASFSLDRVITQIGLRVLGSDFARNNAYEQSAIVENLLAQQRMLLIWDNFDTVRSLPAPAAVMRPLDDTGSAELRGFLTRVADGGHSAVIITSRNREGWLGDVRRISIGGLASHEAAEYAGNLLEPYPAAIPRRATRMFGELMEWLDGHPLSMRLVLPHLGSIGPTELLDGLRGIASLPKDNDFEVRRTVSLQTSITYSYVHLADKTRRLLPAVCLLQGVVDPRVFASFSQAPEVPERFHGSTAQDWHAALTDAVRTGLLTQVDANMCRIHPALPAFLASQWRVEEPVEHDRVRDAATRALLTAHVELGQQLSSKIVGGDAELAFHVLGFQRQNLSALLGYALRHELWEQAQALAQPLGRFWEARGMDQEADAWAERARVATEFPEGTPPHLESPAGSLWLFAVGGQAGRQLRRSQLDDAERTYLQILAMLQTQIVSCEQRGYLSTAYHQLGRVCQERRQLDDAESWYLKSLAIEEELGYQPGISASLHQLGRVCQERGRLDDAERWYLKSLAVEVDLNNELGMAASYGQLGVLAEDRGRLDDAEDWYGKSLAIEAALDHKSAMARIYHQLGVVAQKRKRLDDAENWYIRSLAIEEELDNKPGMASNYRQLALLAQKRGQLRLALEWTVRQVGLLGKLSNDPRLEHLVGLTADLGIDTLEVVWQEVTGRPLPEPLRSRIDSLLSLSADDSERNGHGRHDHG